MSAMTIRKYRQLVLTMRNRQRWRNLQPSYIIGL